MSGKRSKNKKHPARGNQSQTSGKTWLSLALFIAAGLLIFYPPYFRGLFFPREMFITHIITALIFAGVWYKKIRDQEYNFLKTPLDWAVLAYAAAYLLSLIGAVDRGEALYGFLKVLNYFMVYWIISQLVKNQINFDNIIKILVASGTGVAIIGLLAAAGFIHYPNAFNGKVINSTLQYSNAAGTYLGIIGLLAISQWVTSSSLLKKMLYAAGAYFLLLVTLAAVSKGAWVAVAIGAVILLLLAPGLYRVKTVYCMLLTLGAALIASSRLIPAITRGSNGEAVLFCFIGLIIMLLGQWLAAILENRVYPKGRNLAVIIGAVYITAVTASAGMLMTNNPDSGQVVQEVSNLTDLESLSYSSRIDFIRWGFDVIGDYPIIGTGAGGWESIYQQYQDKIFWSSEIHSSIMQAWVEAGTLGMLAFVSIWILFLLMFYQIYVKNKSRNGDPQLFIKTGGVFAAAIALGIHSSVDFDLSLPALSILLWTLFALINSIGQIEEINFKVMKLDNVVLNITVSSIICLVLLGLGIAFNFAYSYSNQGLEAIEKAQSAQTGDIRGQQLAGAEYYYRKAISLDPYNAMYHADLAQVYAIIYQQLKTGNDKLAAQYYSMALSEIDKVEQLAPFHFKARTAVINSTMQLGNIDETIKHLLAAVKASPWVIDTYDLAIKTLWSGVEHYQQLGNHELANKYAQEIVKLETKWAEQVHKLESSGASSDMKEFKLSSHSLQTIKKAHNILNP
jgi:O-antigen ligase